MQTFRAHAPASQVISRLRRQIGVSGGVLAYDGDGASALGSN
jgi:hypothetical protein